MMLNLKLREDLTQCFQNYLRVMTAADILNKENTALKLKVEQAKNDDNGKLYALQSRVQILENQVADRDARLIQIEKSYEARVETLKQQLTETQRENTVLAEQFTDLQRMYFKASKKGGGGGDTSQLQQLLNEKAAALVQVDQLQHQKQILELELADFKTNMRLEHTELAAKMQGKPTNFSGNPKDFNEIVQISAQLDLMTVQNKDRFIGLKELCIYANSGPQAINQLQSLYPGKQAAISLASSDEKVIRGGLFLAEKVLKDSPNQIMIFLQNDGGAHCLQQLASANEQIRVEALKVFPHLALVPLPVKFMNELLVRVAVLLDESLQADTVVNKQQALLALEIVSNWLRSSPLSERQKKSETLYNFSIVQLAIKHLESSSLQVKQRSLHFLALAQLNAFHVEEILFSEDLLKTLLAMMHEKEYSLQKGAASFFRNLSKLFSDVKLAEAAQRLDHKDIYESLVSLNQSDDIFALNLESLHNLLKSSNKVSYTALDFVNRGLVADYLNPLLARNFQTLQPDSHVFLSCILRLITENPHVSSQVNQQLEANRLSEMLQQSDKVEVRRNLFATITHLMWSQKQRERISKLADQIIAEAQKLLQSKADDVNTKREAVTMLAQFTDSLENVKILSTFSCERLLIGILQDAKAKSEVKKASLRALTVLYSAGVLYGYQAATSVYVVREIESIDTLFSLMVEAIEGTIRDENNQQLDWQIVILTMKLIYVVCFSSVAFQRVLTDEHISILHRVLEKSIAEKQTKVTLLWFRLISFFSKFQGVQNQLLTQPLIKVIFSSLQAGNQMDYKFILTVLYGFVNNTIAHDIIRSLSWTQGIEVLLINCFSSEPMAVSKIFQVLAKDPTIFSQMNNMMSSDHLSEVHNAPQGTTTFWADTHVPAHLKGVLVEEDNDIFVGNLKLEITQQHNLLTQLLKMNYQVSSDELELRLYPELPSESATLGQDDQASILGGSPDANKLRSMRPLSHQGKDKLPLPKAVSLKDMKKTNLTEKALNKLDMIGKIKRQHEVLQMPKDDPGREQSKFVNDFLSKVTLNQGEAAKNRSSSVPHFRGGGAYGLPPTGRFVGFNDNMVYGGVGGAEVTPEDSKSRFLVQHDNNYAKVLQNAVGGGKTNLENNINNTITIRKDQVKFNGAPAVLTGEPSSNNFNRLRKATVANQYGAV